MSLTNSTPLTPSAANPTFESGNRSDSTNGIYKLLIGLGLLVAVVSVGLLSASSGKVGETQWTVSFAGIGLGILISIGSYSLSTQSKYSEIRAQQKETIDEAKEQFESLSGRDWMTGLDTIAGLTNDVEKELARSGRYKREFSVLFVTPRFEGNTEQLQSSHISAIEIYTADILKKVLRVSDGMARRTDVFGFVALLPETNVQGGNIAGERVASALQSPYKIGPWEDQAEMIALDSEVLSFPENEQEIIARFDITAESGEAPAGKPLPANA